jgi:hypothetical protein
VRFTEERCARAASDEADDDERRGRQRSALRRRAREGNDVSGIARLKRALSPKLWRSNTHPLALAWLMLERIASGGIADASWSVAP